MYVNISRSKLLINKKRFSRTSRKANKPAPKCNHCGGLIRENGEMIACIMCSREATHHCSLCTHKLLSEIAPKDKKSA